jgi:hypothetical protein
VKCNARVAYYFLEQGRLCWRCIYITYDHLKTHRKPPCSRSFYMARPVLDPECNQNAEVDETLLYRNYPSTDPIAY